jgi:hypothetical protein
MGWIGNYFVSCTQPRKTLSRLEEKTVFGKKRFALELKNGKKRNLGNFKTQSELINWNTNVSVRKLKY